MLIITKGLALLGYRILSDPQFLREVRSARDVMLDMSSNPNLRPRR